MYRELEYVDDTVNPDEEPYRSSHHGNRKLYERAVMQLFVDGRRVVVPSGFGGEVKPPKGARALYTVRVDASDGVGLRDLFYGLEEVKRRKKSITVEHEVDGAKARYRVVRTSGGGQGHGTLHDELIEGEPVMFDGHGRRVPGAEDPGDRHR